MSYQRILTVQDISCLGQCSLTAALPILSACGFETCILPSALLSTHTGGFSGYTFRDLTDDIPRIRQHWQKEGIRFDAVYTGYLAGARQIDEVLDLIGALLAPGGMVAVDPAMADHGRLYAGFDEAFAAAMKKLCAAADIILPNITEACFLTGVPYRETYDPDRRQLSSVHHRRGGIGKGTPLLLCPQTHRPNLPRNRRHLRLRLHRRLSQRKTGAGGGKNRGGIHRPLH